MIKARCTATVPVLILSTCLTLPAAADGDEPDAERAEPLRETVEVVAEQERLEPDALDPASLHDGRASNLALAFASLPGVSGVRRAQNALEPVIRGLGWERVQTQVDGLPLHGACPARMDPPSTLVATGAVGEASVVRGLASVTLGPAGTGGRLVISTDSPAPAKPAERTVRPWARLTRDDARDGWSGGAGLRGRAGRFGYAAGVETLRHESYTSAGGIEVPAGQKEQSGFVSLDRGSQSGHRWSVGASLVDVEDTDYPSLPMNTDDVLTRIYRGSYRFFEADPDRAFAGLRARLGVARVDHLMSNRGKPTRRMVEAETESLADTIAAGIDSRWRLGGSATLAVGADLTLLERDALRERFVVARGVTFYDHLWPDVSQDDVGVFAELGVELAPRWTLRAGARHDSVSSGTGADDDPGLGGRTIRENYVRFYGSDAADTDRDESLLTGNVLVMGRLTERLTVEAGLGVASRAASMTERYFSFAPAPNGYVVGNPSLEHEKKRELSLTLALGAETIGARLSAYAFDVRDFINGIVLAEIDVNGDGRPDLVRGFDNVDATLRGAELAAEYRPTGRWRIPASVAYVRAKNDDTGGALPEIPPLEGRLAVKRLLGGTRGWFELGGRFADGQDRIDESFGEDATPGFSVWHLRGSWAFAEWLSLDVGVENLLDREYHEHLTREAALAVGDLAAGDEIPQPGRSLFVSLRAALD